VKDPVANYLLSGSYQWRRQLTIIAKTAQFFGLRLRGSFSVELAYPVRDSVDGKKFAEITNIA
jgi:hypothetical protein